MTLLLRRVPDNLSERYDVVCGGETIGTIFKSGGYDPWHWSVWRYRLHERCHGTSTTREAAMSDLATVFRAWLAIMDIREPEAGKPFDVPMGKYQHGR